MEKNYSNKMNNLRVVRRTFWGCTSDEGAGWCWWCWCDEVVRTDLPRGQRIIFLLWKFTARAPLPRTGNASFNWKMDFSYIWHIVQCTWRVERASLSAITLSVMMIKCTRASIEIFVYYIYIVLVGKFMFLVILIIRFNLK